MRKACYTRLPGQRAQRGSLRWARWLWVLPLALAALWWLGPRYDAGPEAATARPVPPLAAAELDAWLATQEAQHTGLRPGAAKGIVWHGPPGQRTPWAVVYLHGFTASRVETAPLAEQVAQALGANLFYTRLAGHGLPPDALGVATMQDWLADAVEAVRIGRALGERVLVIGTSTGATLGAWLALHPEQVDATVHAQVWISPNFGPADKRTEWLLGPWGRQIAHAITGGTVGAPSGDARIDAGWTRVYPVDALLPMMALVQRVREADLGRVRTPILLLYSPADRTVDPALTRAVFNRLGSPTKLLEEVHDSTDRDQHVLAGALRSPGNTKRLAQRIVAWVQLGQ